MGLNDLIKRDAARFVSNGKDHGTPVLFIAPGVNGMQATVNCTTTKTSFRIDPNSGASIISREIWLTVAEKSLVGAGYPTRNERAEIYLKDHKVQFADASGVVSTYTIQLQFPDEKLGLIKCSLSYFKN